MTTTTVRIDRATAEVLRELATDSGRSIADVMAEAVEALRRQRLLDETNAAYAALRADSDRWNEELAERADWEATLGDNLESD